MKNAILVLALFSSVTAIACQQEAQFIGKVTNYSKTDCSYDINFSMFNSSYVCPLDIDEAGPARLTDKSCSLKNGDPISGVLIRNSENEIVLE
ncbi:MAG: hypothetical protein H7177_03865 [Rhizobacter sp.]|nr:hypothetical protein [Bacteriovorax sp.]